MSPPIVETFLAMLRQRDPLTERHTRRVEELAVLFARALRINENAMRLAALLHDVGKLGIPDHILLKPGKLSDEEWEVMRLHVSFSYDLARQVTRDPEVLAAVRSYHEHWDGRGYPNGLTGSQIPIMAQALAIADAWDAISQARVYSAGCDHAESATILLAGEYTHFAPGFPQLFLAEVIAHPTFTMRSLGVTTAG